MADSPEIILITLISIWRAKSIYFLISLTYTRLYSELDLSYMVVLQNKSTARQRSWKYFSVLAICQFV